MFHLALRGRQACISIMGSSTVTRHAAPRGQCTGPHLSVGSIWYSIRNKHIQCVASPAWERRFTRCAVSPSSLLREEVYLVCSGPFNPLEKWGLPSVQWAPYPSWKRRSTRCAVGPSSLLREEAYTYCAVGPSSLLRKEVYPVCNGPFIPVVREGLPSVQWAPPPSWERRFIPNVQWALHPSC